jgi:preprotein translocase subunit SecE
MAKSAVVTSAEENKLGARLKSWPQRAKGFYGDVRTEMKKVTTPSMKEVQATTAVVIIAVAIFGLYFFVVDLIIGRGINAALQYFTH